MNDNPLEPDIGKTDSTQPEREGTTADTFRSLQELVDYVSGKSLLQLPQEDSGLAEPLPFPFLAIVGQREMKLALLLGLVHPNLGGILLIGPRGTAKTTAVRSLLDLLPEVERSTCHYGCLPEDVETGGISAICPDCAKKYAAGEPLTTSDRARLVELPLNSRLEDVVGGINERAAVEHERMRIRRGILAHAYRARFLLIGSMNPEEGRLRPQILDRFGLRVIVQGLEKQTERLEAYRRVQAYQANPRQMIAQFAEELEAARDEIYAARVHLSQVTIPDKVANPAIVMVQKMGIDSLRAEIT